MTCSLRTDDVKPPSLVSIGGMWVNTVWNMRREVLCGSVDLEHVSVETFLVERVGR